MSLAWQPQHRKLNEERFAGCVTEMVMQLPGDSQRRSVTAMSLRKLPGWMMGIEMGKIKNTEVRAKVIQYQNECDDALWQYWSDGIAINPRAAFAVNTGDKLTAGEAETLRLMLKTAVERLPKEKQGGAMMQGWSKLKVHFKVGYREIPRHEFSEAVSIVARHTAEWDVVDDLPAAKPSLDGAVRMDWAFTLATQAAAKVQRAVFSCVMNGGEDWKRGRYLLSFDRDRVDDELMAKASQIQHNDCIVPVDRFHAVIDDSIGVDAQTLTRLASTCMTKLGRMAQSNSKALAV